MAGRPDLNRQPMVRGSDMGMTTCPDEEDALLAGCGRHSRPDSRLTRRRARRASFRTRCSAEAPSSLEIQQHAAKSQSANARVKPAPPGNVADERLPFR